MLGRLGHDFQLGDGSSALAVGRADTVRTRIAAADHDHMLAGGQDFRPVADRLVVQAAVLLGEELHGEMHAIELPPRHGHVTGVLGAARQDHRVEFFLDLLNGDGDADMAVGAKFHALGPHLRHAPVDQVFLHLEVGDAVAHQAANTGVLFVQHHAVAGAGQLLGAGHAGRAGADHGDGLARAVLGDAGHDPAFRPAFFDDRDFDGLDGHRLFGDVQGTGRLARRGADPARKLREIIGRMQNTQGFLPFALIDHVVPFRDDVVDRTAAVAIGDAAIHAAGALLPGLGLGQGNGEFVVVLQALRRRRVGSIAPGDLHEACRFTHTVYAPPTATLSPTRAAAWDWACISCKARR